MRIVWTERAINDLEGIEIYIASDNPEMATEFVEEILESASIISDNPQIGRIVPELSQESLRELIHKNYRIVYLLRKKSIDILTVFERHKLFPESIM